MDNSLITDNSIAYSVKKIRARLAKYETIVAVSPTARTRISDIRTTKGVLQVRELYNGGRWMPLRDRTLEVTA